MYSAGICPRCAFITYRGGGKPGWPRSALHSSSEKIIRCRPLLWEGKMPRWAFSFLPLFQHLWKLIIWFCLYSQWLCFFFLLFIFRNRGATVLGRHTEAGWHPHCRFLSWNQSQIKIVKVCHVSFPFRWQTGHQVDTRRLFDIVLLGQNAALFSRKENFKMLAPIGHIYNSCLCFLTYTSIPLIWQLEELS